MSFLRNSPIGVVCNYVAKSKHQQRIYISLSLIVMEKKKKPIFEKRIFWDVNFEQIDYDAKANFVIERVFERFYTDRPESALGNNSGLGLSITKQIVEAHRGRIIASNRTVSDGDGLPQVAGARFVVRLPAS